MIDWRWESFESYVNPNEFSFSDPGPLFAPIKTFTIKRNADLTLILETTASADSKSNAVQYPAGTVRFNEDTATLTSVTGEKTVTLIGVQPGSAVRSYTGNGSEGETRQTSTLHRLIGHTINPNEAAYTMDWLSNVSSNYLWPDTTNRDDTTGKTLTLGQGGSAPTLTYTCKQGGGSRNCAKLNIAGQEVYLCHLKYDKPTEIKDPAFILYVGIPSDEVREKIRIVLSFLLGTYFVYLGHSTFCKDWHLKSYEAMSAYALGGRAYEIAPCPPAPLGRKYEREIDRALLSQMASSMYAHYDALKFRSLHWAIWHALSATPHIAPVHYGAAIEALQRAYVKSNPDTYNTTLLCAGHWSSLKRAAEAIVNALPINKITKEILKNKITSLNSKPPNVLQDEILNSLGLSLSKIEREAWKRRNQAGHGNYGKPEDSAQLIRETKLLWLRFNRMVLAITKASDAYYDYFSLGHPTRKLSDEIP